MKKIVLASNNAHKMLEINQALKQFDIEVISLDEVGFNQEIIEDGTTFFENALIKAKTVGDFSGLVTLADDSGLVVHALPGELGIHSKRFSPSGNDFLNNKLLLERMKNKTNRDAYFVSQLVLYFPKTKKFIPYQGRVYGTIAKDMQGISGFGYDPLFIVDNLNKRMGEMTRSEKNEISHRGLAIKKLVEDIDNEVISI